MQELSVSAPEPVGTAGINRAAFLPLCCFMELRAELEGWWFAFLSEPREADGFHEESYITLAGFECGWIHIRNPRASQLCLCVLQHHSPGN